MSPRVQRIALFTYAQVILEPLYVLLDKDGSPPILPLLYSVHLSRFGYTYHLQEGIDHRGRLTSRLIQQDISDTTIRSYVYKLSKFLHYIEKLNPESITDIHQSSSISEKLVNLYLNEFLPTHIKSPKSVPSHAAALSSYFNWLASLNLTSPIKPRILRKTRQHIADIGGSPHYIQYVPPEGRLRLLTACPTLSEKLMMRMGFEVGLRTSEVAALRVEGDGKLDSLFKKLSDPYYESRELFRYHLEGKYTKGGKSRWIYFNRELLKDMQRYFDTERKALLVEAKQPSNSFYLRRDKRFAGTAIGREQASRIFHRLKLKAGLNPHLHFHDLRHTFATELFHEELAGSDGRETRSESAALIVVAQRLGHSFTRDGHAPPTTTRYIRMRTEMLQSQSDVTHHD